MKSVSMTDISGTAHDFASQAEIYVDWFDRLTVDEALSVNMRELHELLGLVQVAAARLPAIAPDGELSDELDYKHGSATAIRPRLPIDAYSVVFDPLEYNPVEAPRPVIATVAEDLSDIYDDVMEGLVLYRAGRIQSAVWKWHFTYFAHWGRHLSHAQSAIWQYLSQGNWA